MASTSSPRRSCAQLVALLLIAAAGAAVLVVPTGRAGAVAGGTAVAGAADPAPWYVRLTSRFSGYAMLCGGALVSDQWVLTARHCVMPETAVPNSASVVTAPYAGAPDGAQRQYGVDVDRIQFTTAPTAGVQGPVDIALLHLSSPVTITPYASPVPLAPQNTPLDGLDATLAGMAASSTTLRVGHTSIAHAPCITGADFHLCTLPAIAQSGDSGGPLTVPAQDGRPELVGEVVSSGVYVAVTAPEVHSWISTVVGSGLPAAAPITSATPPIQPGSVGGNGTPPTAQASVASSSIERDGWSLAALTDHDPVDASGRPLTRGFHSAYGPDRYAQQWATVDLGSPRTIQHIRLTPATYNGVPKYGFPAAFQIQVSNDLAFAASNTITVANVTGPSAAQFYDFALSLPLRLRFVRILATELGPIVIPGMYALVMQELAVTAAP